MSSLIPVEKNLAETSTPPKVVDGSLDFSTNQWTGYVTQADFDLIGNTLTLSPAAPGLLSDIQSVMLLMLCKKLSETERGQTLLVHLIETYLTSIEKVISHIYKAGAQNWLSGLVGNSVAVDIYARLGLISPRDAMQKRAWIDHIIGNEYNVGFALHTIDAVTTMVDATSVQHAEGQNSAGGLGIGAIAGLLKAMK
jgi:hypothetical protein